METEGGRVLVTPSGDSNLTRGAAVGRGCLPSRARQGVQVKGTQGASMLKDLDRVLELTDQLGKIPPRIEALSGVGNFLCFKYR
jgi:hypothetical protein